METAVQTSPPVSGVEQDPNYQRSIRAGGTPTGAQAFARRVARAQQLLDEQTARQPEHLQPGYRWADGVTRGGRRVAVREGNSPPGDSKRLNLRNRLPHPRRLLLPLCHLARKRRCPRIWHQRGPGRPWPVGCVDRATVRRPASHREYCNTPARS